MKRYQKILLGILIAILVVLGGIQIYISFFLEDQLEETVITRFQETTDDAYDLAINDVDLWVLGRKINVSGIEITKKEKGTGTDIQATLEEFSISGIGILNYLINQNLNLNEIELVNPQIFITSPGKSQNGGNTDPTAMSRKLSETILQELDKATVSDLRIHGLSLDYNRADHPMNPVLAFQDSDIHLSNIQIDSTSLKENRVLPAGGLSFTFRKIRYHTNNELYELTAGQLEFSSENRRMEIDSIRLNPRFNKQEFANKMDYEIDQIDLELSQVSWEGIDIEQLNRADGLSSKHISLKSVDLDVYRDKRPPSPPENRPPLPHEMLNNIQFPFSVDSLTITESSIRYSERLEEAEKAGFIDFTDLSATFKSVSNNEERWKEGDNPTLYAETSVMGEARLNATFDFAVGDSSNQQQINGNLQSMDMQPLNDALIPLAFVRIDDGQILGMDFDMTLTNEQAKGEVILRYEDLKISLLNKNTNSETIDKKVISFLANEFKLESDNKGEDLRIGEVDFERAKDKSTFNYWWKSLLSGLKSSVGF